MAEITSADHRSRLGRGLAALLSSAEERPDIQKGVVLAALELIRSNPRNPRRNFDEAELEELAASIRERGILQPILVRVVSDTGSYEIVAGERRWRAAQRANLHEIPVLIIEANDRDALEIAIVENIQRADLNPLEEAAGYAQLVANYKYSHGDIARVVGRSRSHIANTIRLANLPEHTQALLAQGKISAGHGRALLSLPDPNALADRVVAEGLTVRDVEHLGQQAASQVGRPRRAARQSADTNAFEDRLTLALGTKVSIRMAGNAGEIRISFRDLEQLDGICGRLLATF